MLFEIGGADEEAAKAALRLVAMKMPVRCRLVYRVRGH
jgi:ribosomal protein L16/L10AE